MSHFGLSTYSMYVEAQIGLVYLLSTKGHLKIQGQNRRGSVENKKNHRRPQQQHFCYSCQENDGNMLERGCTSITIEVGLLQNV